MSSKWRLWCFGFEKNNVHEGTGTLGVSVNATTPLRGTYDGNLFFERDGDDSLLAFVRHSFLWGDGGLDDNWRSAFGSFVIKTPSAGFANTVNLYQDIDDAFSAGNELECDAAGLLTVRGVTTQVFSTTMSDGTEYRIAFQIVRGVRHAVRLYDSSDVLLEEHSVKAVSSSGAVFCFGHRQKTTYTGTNPNAHAFYDNCIFFYTDDSGADAMWIENDQELQLVTVDITSPPAPAHDEFDGSPEATNKEVNVDDISPHDADASYNESTVVIEGAKEHQTYPVEVGPSLSGDDVINGVMLGSTVRKRSATSSLLGAEMNVYHDAIDDLYVLTGIASPWGYRSHGLGRRASRVRWDEAARNSLELGHANEMVAYDTERNASFHLTNLPDADGTDDGDWVPSTGTDAWAVLDEDAPGDVGDYIESSTVGHRQDLTFPDPTIPAGTILSGVSLYVGVANLNAGAAVGVKAFYKDSGGTRHYTPQVDLGGFANGVCQVFWAKDPEDDSVWTAAKLGAREFGVEVVSGGGSASVRCTYFNVDINLLSQLRVTSTFLYTVYGPLIWFESAPSLVVSQAVNRAATI